MALKARKTKVKVGFGKKEDKTEKYNNAQAATEDMLTPDLLSRNVGATVGVKYSRTFAQNKQAQKVKYVATDVAVNDNEGNGGGSEQGGGTTPPSGGNGNEGE